jgi:predicted dehydrogenase
MITAEQKPKCFYEEKDLLERVEEIDLLVIATPNFLHAPHLLRWAMHPICILVEKPVAISEKQVLALQVASPSFQANIWVAMEYRYIPGK